MAPSDIEYLIDESFSHFIDTILKYSENPYHIDYEGMFFKGKANLYHKLNDIFKENEDKIEKDKKIIDLMAKYIASTDKDETICKNNMTTLCDNYDANCIECIKLYFENQAEIKGE